MTTTGACKQCAGPTHVHIISSDRCAPNAFCSTACVRLYTKEQP